MIAASKSVGIMHYNDKFYFTDSHSCGSKGENIGSSTGKACIIECDTLEELERVCKRAVGSGNQQFTINHIQVDIKYDPVLELLRENEGINDLLQNDKIQPN